MNQAIELGLDTFGDITDAADGKPLNAAQVMRNIVEEAVLADQLGGAFIESFPLFGFDLKDYERLFDEKLDLFAAVLKQQPVTWQGTTRPPLTNQSVYPRTESGHLATWIGVGGTPQSVLRAAHYGLPMMLAIIGGEPQRFAPFVDLYRRALKEMNRPELPIGLHSHGFVGETDA